MRQCELALGWTCCCHCPRPCPPVTMVSISGIMYLTKMGKKTAAREERSESMWEKELSRYQVSEKGGAPHADISLQPLMQTTVKQLFPCSPRRVHGGAGSMEGPVSPLRRPHWSRWMPKEWCDPVGSAHRSRLLAGPVAPWSEAHVGVSLLAGLWTHAGTACSWRTASCGEDSHRAVHEELQSLGRTRVGKVHGDMSPVGENPTLEKGKSVRSAPCDKERVAETMWDELTTNPIPFSLHSWGVEGRKFGSKVKPRKKRGVGNGWF